MHGLLLSARVPPRPALEGQDLGVTLGQFRHIALLPDTLIVGGQRPTMGNPRGRRVCTGGLLRRTLTDRGPFSLSDIPHRLWAGGRVHRRLPRSCRPDRAADTRRGYHPPHPWW